ncbi:endonuclease III [Syntrophomonas erecta]
MDDKSQRAEVIIRRLQQEYPQAKTRLHYTELFQLLVAIVLSAQSTDEQVNKVTPRLFEKYPQPGDLAEGELAEIEELIRGVGLYRNKAAHLKKLARIIHDQYHDQVPDEFDELLKLPGVGRKTANVMIAVGFNQPALGVDTHVHRVSNRLGLVSSKSADKTEGQLKKILPQKHWIKAHHLLIFHGRKVCKARNPLCSQCIVEDICAKNMDHDSGSQKAVRKA